MAPVVAASAAAQVELLPPPAASTATPHQDCKGDSPQRLGLLVGFSSTGM